MFRSIKNKLIFLFRIADLTPLLVMRLIAYPTAQKAFQETTISNLQLVGSKKVFQVNDWFRKLKNKAERIARNPFTAVATNLIKTDSTTISQFISHIPYVTDFYGFLISDLSGIVRVSTNNKLIGFDISNNEGFDHAIRGMTYLSDIPSLFSHDSDKFTSEQIGRASC